MSRDTFEELALRLGHTFSDIGLLKTALTHRSFAHEARGNIENNERMEFLGDAILAAASSIHLYQVLDSASEGELTRRRSDLVRERTLAQIARQKGVGEALRLGRGESRSGGAEKPRLLASALEACIAAIFLDAGLETALRLTQDLITRYVRDGGDDAFDAKSRLQEVTQAHWGIPPTYTLNEANGPDHDRWFVVQVGISDRLLGNGEGPSKVEAEQRAAQAAIEHLSQEEDSTAIATTPEAEET